MASAADSPPRPLRSRTARSRPVHTVASGAGLHAEVHARVAGRLLGEEVTPVLDLGCGSGDLARRLPDGHWVGVDSSLGRLGGAPQPSFAADPEELPFPASRFGSVALLFALGRLGDRARVLGEALRVLRPGGVLAIAAPDGAADGGGGGFERSVADALEVTGFVAVELNPRGALAFARRP